MCFIPVWFGEMDGMSGTAEYDAIVVGAGVVGSYAAYHLSKRGLHVLLIDQFPLPHTRGSSSGPSRIIRNAYREDYYAKLMPEAYRMWRVLEREADTKLIKKTGLLSVGENDSKWLEGVRTSLLKFSLPCESMTSPEIRNRYPMIQYPNSHVAVLDPEAGIINADRCLQALWLSVKNHGVVIKDGESVKEIIPGSNVTVKTNNGVYMSKRVIVTAGPWSCDLLKPLGVHLPLKTMRGYHVYWKEKRQGQYTPAEGFPLVLDHQYREDGYTYFYAFPSVEYPGLLKVGMRKVPPPYYSHPDDRDKGLDLQPFIQEVGEWVRRHLPGVEDTPSISEPCVYTMSPDGDFVIDKHPDHSNIVIGAGFSGHGFKLAPVAGKLLTQLSMNEAPSIDMSHFKIARFSTKQSKL